MDLFGPLWRPRSLFARSLLALWVLGAARGTRADCECGYSAAMDGGVHVFTDLIETDFAHLDDIASNTDWVRQAFNLTAGAARGPFGESFAVDQMRTAPTADAATEAGVAADGQPAGLQLTVGSQLVDGMVPVAEIDSNRTDVLFGTYRAGIKLTSVVGTCSAFFWYFNDTQEIDMEFLSREYDASNGTFPVNLVLQSRAAAEAGFDAAATPTFQKVNLPFDPTAAFHEYRIDFLPGTVVFYADNAVLARMQSAAVPTHAGHLVLQQWSNGNPGWTGGPPAEDATTTVAYVKAYFNSSTAQRQSDWARRCVDDTAPGAVCAIPEVSATDSSATTFFFSQQHNQTANQTVSGQDSAGGRLSVTLAPMFAVAIAVGGSLVGLW